MKDAKRELDPVLFLCRKLIESEIKINSDACKAVAIDLKYSGYIKRAEEQFHKIRSMDKQKINWEEIANSNNVSFECRQRVQKIKPETFGQLRLIEGIRPATLAIVAGKLL
jgi:tRNA uridine 5-carboxymethylaminomethyl modification enzyme